MEESFTGEDTALKVFYKDLKAPLRRRKANIIGFFRLEKSTSIMIFEDGMVWKLDSEQDTGILKHYMLKLPFAKSTECLFEAEHGMLML